MGVGRGRDGKGKGRAIYIQVYMDCVRGWMAGTTTHIGKPVPPAGAVSRPQPPHGRRLPPSFSLFNRWSLAGGWEVEDEMPGCCFLGCGMLWC